MSQRPRLAARRNIDDSCALLRSV